MVTIDIFKNGRWQLAALLQIDDERFGYTGKASLDYEPQYAVENLELPDAAVSVNHPVNFVTYDSDRWPAFLLDILPSGAGRRNWADRLDLNDGRSHDVTMLCHACANPPGNLRIRESVENRAVGQLPDSTGALSSESNHPGFDREDILERQEHFIEYAFQMGAHAASASDVGGESPKFLLVQNYQGKWFAEGALQDSKIAKHWLVKFARGRTEGDKSVLINEAPYLEVARACGLHVGEALTFESEALFIPRFDRQSGDGKVERYPFESLYSVAEISEYGASTPHETLLTALLKQVPTAIQESTIMEYIKRDVLNIVMGNKDNHARNTAIMRGENGMSLSPIFDFAPMFRDPSGVPRASRWNADCEIAGVPIWAKVAEQFADSKGIKEQLKQFSKCIESLPDTMRTKGVEDIIIELRMQSIEANTRTLRGAD